MKRTLELRYSIHLTGALVVLTLAIWLSTGTMAPYAAMSTNPLVLEPCHYLANVDHYHFEAIFRMIDGDDRSFWSGSVVLRRLLYPILAYPFVRTFGLLMGGLVATALLHAIALVAFGAFVRRRTGDRGAIAVLWILATYPGITYWSGLPYSYVAIVPGSLFLLMLLYRLAATITPGDVVRTAFLIGLVFLAYDFLPFFAPAAVMILAAQRRWRHLLPALVGLAVPSLLVAIMFAAMGVAIVNSNTGTYVTGILSYLNSDRYGAEWLGTLLRLPAILVSNALFGNMIFLPLLTAVATIIGIRLRVRITHLPEKALLLAVVAVFLFNNAPPPYYGWQMRGEWVARLYQPVFVAFLMIIARSTESLTLRRARLWGAAIALTVLANTSIAFGPLLMNPLAAYAYHKFYVHSPPQALLVNMERFGRRPLGFCSDSHEWDYLPNTKTPYNRPAYMYRYPPR